MEAAGVLRGGNERQLDARAEAEDAVAGDFEIAVARLVVEKLVLLPAADHPGRQVGRIQQETQTVCLLNEDFLRPGERRRPKCVSICRYASSELTERRADKIFSICSAVTSGRRGLGVVVFTAHEDRRQAGAGQAGISMRQADDLGEDAVGEKPISLQETGGSIVLSMKPGSPGTRKEIP